VPGAELHLFHDGGHFFPITRAADYGERVLRFLAGDAAMQPAASALEAYDHAR
jgi:hypothetical protein